MTIDDDVAAVLQRRTRETGRSFKEVVNEALRAGLTESSELGPIDLIYPVRHRPDRSPLTVDQALELLDLCTRPGHVVALDPTQHHAGIVRGLLEKAGTGGSLVTDAHLAALAIEHGATLCSAGPDFGRFRGLRWRNPLDDRTVPEGLSRRSQPPGPGTRRSCG